MDKLTPYAIPTEYKGYKFRSRLEARWAVFLDALGVKWEYESEGYYLGDGIYYLPDFRLHNVSINHGHRSRNCTIYLEVKGQMNDEDAVKIKRFYEIGRDPENHYKESESAIIVVNNIPDGEDMNEIIRSILKEANNHQNDWPTFFNFETIDGDTYPAIPGIDLQGTFTLFGYGDNYTWCMDKQATERAYRLARQSRFEHGETPRRVERCAS